MVRVSRANAKVRLRVCRREAEATPSPGTADWADPAGTSILSALRACFFLRRISSACTISSKDRTCSGSDLPKLLRQHSTINSGRGNFHGACPLSASEPSFRGFIPSSRAICVCAWLNVKRLLTSNQACRPDMDQRAGFPCSHCGQHDHGAEEGRLQIHVRLLASVATTST